MCSVVFICHGVRQQLLTPYPHAAPGDLKPNTRIERYNCPVPASNCEAVVQPLGLGLSTSLQRVGDDTVERNGMSQEKISSVRSGQYQNVENHI